MVPISPQVVEMILPTIKTPKGFTIVELLVVIGIILIILGVAVPRLNRSTEGAKLKTTADSLHGLLETAKSYAMTQNIRCALVNNMPAAGQVSIAKQDVDDIDNDSDTSEYIGFDVPFKIPSGINVALTADEQIVFLPSGSVEDSSDTTITVTSSSMQKSKTISVNTTTGFIKIN